LLSISGHPTPEYAYFALKSEFRNLYDSSFAVKSTVPSVWDHSGRGRTELTARDAIAGTPHDGDATAGDATFREHHMLSSAVTVRYLWTMKFASKTS
jgi:hypothetical protein